MSVRNECPTLQSLLFIMQYKKEVVAATPLARGYPSRLYVCMRVKYNKSFSVKAPETNTATRYRYLPGISWVFSYSPFKVLSSELFIFELFTY